MGTHREAWRQTGKRLRRRDRITERDGGISIRKKGETNWRQTTRERERGEREKGVRRERKEER